MSATIGRNPIGIKLAYSADDATYTDLAEVVDIDAPENTVKMLESTHLASPDDCMEKVAGFIEQGGITAEIRYKAANAATLDTLFWAKTAKYWRIAIPDNVGSPGTPTYCKFYGVIEQWKPIPQVNPGMSETLKSKLKLVCTSGKVTFTQAT